MAPSKKPASKDSQSAGPVRTLLIDDQIVFRLGLRIYLEEAMPEVELVGEAGSAEEGIALAEKTRPDLVLLDVSLKDRPTAEALAALRELLPECSVVLLANTPDGDDFTLALNSRAAGYLLKTISPERMVSALREVVRGNPWVQPELAQRFYTEFLEPSRRAPGLPHLVQALTPRQLDVLRLIVQGLRNAEIAERLVISEQTVKTHVANLLRKLGLSSRLQAAQYAVRHRLVQI